MKGRQLLDEADEALRKARYVKAIELYRQVLTDAPDDPMIRARLGEAYRQHKNPERAFHHFKRAAVLYDGLGDPANAYRMLTAANAVQPNEPDILFRIAEHAQQLNLLPDFAAALVHIVKTATGKGDRRRLWALEHLATLHPGDLTVAEHRAEALVEAERVDDAVEAFKRISAAVGPRSPDFLRVLRRAAEIATDRPDHGVDLARVLLVNGHGRDALAVLVPYYESAPDDVGVLELLHVALASIGAMPKAVAARVELLKARATRGQHAESMNEIAGLLQMAPDDLGVLEVCAHASSVFGEQHRSVLLWRRLATLADQRGMRLERDRAVLSLLKLNQDDEQALELGARALQQAGKHDEAADLARRLHEVRSLREAREEAERRRRAGSVPFQRDTPGALPRDALVAEPPEAASDEGLEAHAEDPFEETDEPRSGTMILDDVDVLEVRSDASEESTNERIPAVSRQPRPGTSAPDRMPIVRSPWSHGGPGETLDGDEFDEITHAPEDELEGESEATVAGPRPSAPRGPSGLPASPTATRRGPIGLPEDVTTIAPSERLGRQPPPPAETRSGRLEDELFAGGGASLISDLDDPFFSDGEATGLPADEVTSRIAALVAEEALERDPSLGTDRGIPAAATDIQKLPARPSREWLVADLLEED